MKKIFAIVLTLFLMASVLCVTAFALNEAPTPMGPVLRISVLKDGETEFVEEHYVLEDGWNAAIDLAKSKEKLKAYDAERVVIDLLSDWTAVGDDFGSGVGFDWSTIFIPGDTKITLNMNGHTIDRDLKTDDYDGEVIHVDEEADLIINGGKSGDPIIMPGQPTADVKMGTITGGWSCNGAGGIFIDNDAKVELNNVNVIGNRVTYDDGAGIGVYAGATLVMNGGSVSDNVVRVGFSLDGTFYGGGVLAEKATVTLNGVTIANNINDRLVSSLKGSAIGSKDSKITLKNCLVKDNGLITKYREEKSDEEATEDTESTDAIIFAWGGSVKIENTDFIGNGTKDVWAVRETDHVTSLFHIESADLTMTGGKVTGNNQVFLFIICCGEANVSGVDFTGNESLAMYRDGEYCSKPTSTFTDCKFSAGTPYDEYTYDFQFGNKNANVTFVDCDFGDATFDNKSAAKFENTANSVGSIFGEGSLTMIVAFVALIASVASLVVNLSSNKKKAVPAASNDAAETEDEE